MTNPYTPPVRVDDSRDHSPEIVSELSQRLAGGLCFFFGCILAFHAAAAFDGGLAATVQRTTREPLIALVFFTVGGISCFLAAAAWRSVRKRWFRDYATTLLPRFFTGAIFAFSLYYLMAVLSVIVQSFLSRAGVQVIPGATENLLLFMVLVVSALVSIEVEAWWARNRRHEENIDQQPDVGKAGE